jgi:hypothetical protein
MTKIFSRLRNNLFIYLSTLHVSTTMGHLQVFRYTLFTIELQRYIRIFPLIYIVHKRLFGFVYTFNGMLYQPNHQWLKYLFLNKSI